MTDLLAYMEDDKKWTGMGREHPWSQSESASKSFHDFKKEPEQIRLVLEDFRPHTGYRATETFYTILEWLNGPKSIFESNDCGLRPIKSNDDDQFPRQMKLFGRLMVFFRDLKRNTSLDEMRTFQEAMLACLKGSSVEFKDGCVGLSLFPTRYLEINESGIELVLQFWAYGDDEQTTWTNLNHVFVVLGGCLHHLSTMLAGER